MALKLQDLYALLALLCRGGSRVSYSELAEQTGLAVSVEAALEQFREILGDMDTSEELL